MIGNSNDWMQEPSIKDIPKEKLDFLQTLYDQSQGKSQKELMTILLPLLKKAKEENLVFTKQELSLAIEAIKKHSTPDELNQINKIMV